MKHSFLTRRRRTKLSRQKIYSNIAIFLILIAPIYPVFWSYIQSYSGVVVRGEYDSDSILASYDWDSGEFIPEDVIENWYTAEVVPQEPVILPTELTPPVTSPWTQDNPVAPTLDPKQSLYIRHIVVKGDTLSTIAEKYSLPLWVLRSINNLTSDLLKIGQKITIPRIDGVQYVVKKGDTLSTIASRYGIADMQTIVLASDLKSGATLSVWRTLFLPRPTKDPNKLVAKKPSAPTNVASWKKPSTVISRGNDNIQALSYGNYSLALKVTKGCRSFVWWNCTCFVAKYKNVTWRWNAKEWLANAKKKNVPTGSVPKPGAIIVYNGPGFPPAYGHVGIVMEVHDDHVIVKDMNYRRLNEVTTRKESRSHPAIIGYIYVD